MLCYSYECPAFTMLLSTTTSAFWSIHSLVTGIHYQKNSGMNKIEHIKENKRFFGSVKYIRTSLSWLRNERLLDKPKTQMGLNKIIV